MAQSIEPRKPFADAHSIAYIVVGLASGVFIGCNLPVLAATASVSSDFLRPGENEGVIRTIASAAIGMVGAVMIGTRHRHRWGCAAMYILGPFLLCGACSPGPVMTSLPYYYLALILVHLAFLFAGVWSVDWILARLGRPRPNP